MDSSPTVLITGASRGLGEVVARRFHADGWRVALLARDRSRLAEVALTLGADVELLEADLADPTAPAAVIARLRERWPRLDAVINNAGMQGPIGPLISSNDEGWVDTLRINLLAPVAFCRQAIPWMAAEGSGSIVNLSGGGATGPRENFTAYAAAKAALVRVTETLAQECASIGVRVNAVAPGALNTAMLREVLDAGPDQAGAAEFASASRRAEQGGDDPALAAACIRWLAGAESAPITGRLISAVWDPWQSLAAHAAEVMASDLFTLRRIGTKDRGVTWATS